MASLVDISYCWIGGYGKEYPVSEMVRKWLEMCKWDGNGQSHTAANTRLFYANYETVKIEGSDI